MRDLLLGHISKDRDFVLQAGVQDFALKLARRFRGTFVELKKDQTYRVALKTGQIIDLTFLRGSIHEDLRQRDFTINAMAWSPADGLIDPFGGVQDLKKRLVKVLLPENLVKDPVRVFRAYRHAAQLGFTIQKSTRTHLRELAGGLTRVASERITEELFKTLNTTSAGHYLRLCNKDRIFDPLFGVRPDDLKENLRLISKFDRYINRNHISKVITEYIQGLGQEISQGLTKAGLIRLALLLLNTDHVISKNRPLRLSRAVKKGLKNIQKAWTLMEGRITERRLYEIFQSASDNLMEAALILSMIREKDGERFFIRAEEFSNIKRHTLIKGEEIQRLLHIPQGALIGRILAALQERQFYGELKTKAEARSWIISNFT